MAFLEKQLRVKKSTLPGAGKGLFTKIFIPRNTRIIEYTGRLSSWKEADKQEGNNGYLFYINRNKVIDAAPFKDSLARYANDARGLTRIKGINNNGAYTIENGKVFIDAIKDIPAGSEIFVAYGKEYWDVIRENLKIDAQAKKKKD